MSTNQIKAKRRRYPSDISQNGWKKLKPYLPVSDSGKRTGRQRTDLKAVINGILYVAKTGCIWRSMPDGLPHWATVYGYFNRWSKSGLWQQIHTFLVKKVRPGEEPQQVGRNPTPSAGCIDSQSIKTTACGGEHQGYDAGKQIKATVATGRKRFILTDSQGLLLSVWICAASISEKKAPCSFCGISNETAI